MSDLVVLGKVYYHWKLGQPVVLSSLGMTREKVAEAVGLDIINTI